MKFKDRDNPKPLGGRSREGAWIEIERGELMFPSDVGRSREGAWIEIFSAICSGGCATVAPARERGLKYCVPPIPLIIIAVAPASERGLK